MIPFIGGDQLCGIFHYIFFTSAIYLYKSAKINEYISNWQ